MYWVGEDKSVLGGVFAILKFLPDPLLAEQPGDTQLNILGKSDAEMHNTSTPKTINSLKEQGLNEKDFMASLFIPTILDSAQIDHPWPRNVLN